MAAAADTTPALSVAMPTFNNEAVLRRAVDGWRRFGGDGVELIVVEDGCGDGTVRYLEQVAATEWGRAQFSWVHEEDAHELRCTNRGFRERAARCGGVADDSSAGAWCVPKSARRSTRIRDREVCLSPGLCCLLRTIDRTMEDLRLEPLQSTTAGPGNWARLQEVDAVMRPWIVRRDVSSPSGARRSVPAGGMGRADPRSASAKPAALANHGYERLGA